MKNCKRYNGKIIKYNRVLRKSIEDYTNVKCNLCNSKLELKFGTKYVDIIKCSNSNCDSNIKKDIKLKWKSWMDLDLYDLRLNSMVESGKKGIHTLPNRKEFWLNKGFSEKESVEKVKKIQIKNAKIFKEKKEKNPEKYKAMYQTRIEYWLEKGFSEKEAKQKLYERQATLSLDVCIKKYGYEKGLVIFKDRHSKWMEKQKQGYSKVANDFFDNLIYIINDDSYKILCKEKEKMLIDFDSSLIYKYNFTIENTKKIIEFNGDFWHMNPNKYKATDINKITGKSAQTCWLKDIKKKEFAKENGYDLLFIWESELKDNKDKLIKKCLNFLNS